VPTVPHGSPNGSPVIHCHRQPLPSSQRLAVYCGPFPKPPSVEGQMQTTYQLNLECGHEPQLFTADPSERGKAPTSTYCTSCERIRRVVSVTEHPDYKTQYPLGR
jgi:hypothetical protein